MGLGDKENLTNSRLQEMFQEGGLIARAFHSPQKKKVAKLEFDFSEIENEMKFLGSKRVDGTYKNVERFGQRNRSAILLVPDIEMDLMSGIGFLYDADKSLVKAYMFKDSGTVSQGNHEEYYNIDIDKKKFESILSRKDFTEKYRNYRNTDPNANFEGLKYNEVLANFYPESLVGLVAKDNSLETKIKILVMRNLLREKYNTDLPMVIMDKGKVNMWAPDLEEIALLLEDSKVKIGELSTKFPSTSKLDSLKSLAQDLGYSLGIKDFSDKISSENISPDNKFEIKLEDLEATLSKLTGLPKSGKFTYGIRGRLKEIVNQDRLKEGLAEIENIENYIIQKKDIENLVSLLDKEIALKTSNHKLMDLKDIESFSKAIINNAKAKEPQTIDSELQRNISIYKSSKYAKIKEFLIKVNSFITRDIVSKKVNSSFRTKIKQEKQKKDSRLLSR